MWQGEGTENEAELNRVHVAGRWNKARQLTPQQIRVCVCACVLRNAKSVFLMFVIFHYQVRK
jgi:hypothetical protein